MGTLTGPFLVAAALLAAGGASKVLRPANTARALREMGLPASAPVVRGGAAVELAVAAGALAGGGRLFAGLLAASYLAFTAFVVVALRRGTPLSTCGCFGATDTPPTAVHVGINLAAAAVAGAVALGGRGAGGLLEIADEGSWFLRVAFVALTAVSVALAYAALTLLPKLQKVSTT